MKLQDILSAKGTTVYTIAPDATLAEAVRSLTEHNVGALVVCRRDLAEGEVLLGIITERDVLHWCAGGTCELSGTKVGDIMSTRLITATPGDTVEDIMGVMTNRRIRHLPVLSEGRLVGIISIGDLVKEEFERLAVENRFMRDYIHG